MKTNKQASLLGVLMCTLLITLLASCGGNTSRSGRLSGRYVIQDGTGYRNINYIEFFSDGTYATNREIYQGSYSVERNRLRLEGQLTNSLTVYFKLNGRTLEISENADFVPKYTDIYVKE